MVFSILCVITLGVISATAADVPERVQTKSNLVFYSSFWLNLHHTLYAAAWARRPHTTERPRAEPLPEPLQGALKDTERTDWETAVDFYNRELADRDLLFDREMTAIKEALATTGKTLPKNGLPPDLRQILVKAAPVYRHYWWRMHDDANRAWIADVVSRVAALARAVTPRLEKLMLTPWFAHLVRVDVVRVNKIQGAYTSIDPGVHTVISSGNSNYQQWAGAEMVFHETSHALIVPIIKRIEAAEKVAGKQTRDLWHVVLFWTVGELVRDALERRNISYKPYIYATGLFQRAWPQFQAPVETEWAPYVQGKISLDEAVKKLVLAI